MLGKLTFCQINFSWTTSLIPRIWKMLISRHSSTCLGWIKWRKNAICIIGIKVNFSEKTNSAPVIQKVDEWLLFGSLKPRFVQLKDGVSQNCCKAPCVGSQRKRRNLKPGTQWSVWDDLDTLAGQNQCNANELGHTASADSRTGEQRCHPRAKNEYSSQFSLTYTHASMF